MIQIYLCEDEKIQLEFWKRELERYIKSANIRGKIVSAHQNPKEILEDVEQESYENVQRLFFIDIQMRGYDMDGFGLAKKLRKKSSDYYLVFITAKDDLAYKVFEYQLDVLDFIVKKPQYYLDDIDSIHIIERLNRVFYKIKQDQDTKVKQKIQIGSGSRKFEIIEEDIIYIQAIKETHLIEFNIACKKIQVRKTLKEIYEKVDSKKFIFVNKSCIVQKSMILEIDKKNRRLNLYGGYQVDVSVREMKKICKETERQ